jgi:hypothetical protein
VIIEPVIADHQDRIRLIADLAGIRGVDPAATWAMFGDPISC